MTLKSRNFGLFLVWLTASLGLVVLGTLLVGPAQKPVNWIHVQRDTPLLWLYDGLILILIGLVLTLRSQDQFHKGQMLSLREENRKQMEGLLAHTDELESRCRTYQDQIAGLDAAAQIRDRELEAQARRLTETAFQALQGHMEANGRQLEAVNLALQYHRAEITQLRHGLNSVHSISEPDRIARLTPAEIDAISTAFAPILTEANLMPTTPPTPPIASSVVSSAPPQQQAIEKEREKEREPETSVAEAPIVPSLPQEAHKNASTTFVAPPLHFEVEGNANSKEASSPSPPTPSAAPNTWHIKI